MVGLVDGRVLDECPASPHPPRMQEKMAQPMAMQNVVVVVLVCVVLIELTSFCHIPVEAKVRGYLKVSRVR